MAAQRSIVTVERVHDGNLLDDPALAAGTLGGMYVDAVAVAPRGAWPLGLACRRCRTPWKGAGGAFSGPAYCSYDNHNDFNRSAQTRFGLLISQL